MSTVAQFCFNKPLNRNANGKIVDDMGHTWDVVGNQPTIQFDQAVSGSAALLNSSWIHSDPFPVVQSFTFEFWAKLISFGSNATAYRLGGDNYNYNIYGFYGNFTVPCSQIPYTLDSTISASTSFNHYCLTSTPTTVVLFVNGKKKATYQYSNGGLTTLQFGGNDVWAGGGYVNLYLDSFRLSDKVLYTDDFTPPTEFQLKYRIESDPLGDYYGIKKA